MRKNAWIHRQVKTLTLVLDFERTFRVLVMIMIYFLLSRRGVRQKPNDAFFIKWNHYMLGMVTAISAEKTLV